VKIILLFILTQAGILSSFAQLDTTKADSLIFAQLQATGQKINFASIDEEIIDTVSEIPVDPKLLEFYSNKGVVYDSACSQLELYREVFTWLGVRYRYAGLTKRGVDCAGFVKNICNNIYGTKLSGSARDHFKKCIPVEKNELEEGDLVFFKINQSQISHVGLYMGNNKFAHAAVHGGVTISDLNEKYYSKYYYLGGRLINAPKRTYGQ